MGTTWSTGIIPNAAVTSIRYRVNDGCRFICVCLIIKYETVLVIVNDFDVIVVSKGASSYGLLRTSSHLRTMRRGSSVVVHESRYANLNKFKVV